MLSLIINDFSVCVGLIRSDTQLSEQMRDINELCELKGVAAEGSATTEISYAQLRNQSEILKSLRNLKSGRNQSEI